VIAKLIVAFGVIALYRGVLDRSVHPLEQAMGPGMVWLGQAVFDPVSLADHVKPHLAEGEAATVPAQFGEPGTIVSYSLSSFR